MSELREAFEERSEEVRTYMDFLAQIDVASQSGSPRLSDSATTISPDQQKLLYASVYLQLYNLVEATVTLCVQAVVDAACDPQWKPQDLSAIIRREWIRNTARTHADLNHKNRLEAAVKLVDHVLAAEPLQEGFQIERGGGGNWDDDQIEKMSARLGCKLKVSRAVRRLVKQKMRDDSGPLKLVRSMRNKLAHGEISFTESGSELTVGDLSQLADAVLRYLGEVVDQFDQYLADYEYLDPQARPAGAAA
jgi:hypothetical protein